MPNSKRFFHDPTTYRAACRDGAVLIVVLIVVAILTLAVFSYSRYMFAESQGARIGGRQIQAHAAAESGLEMVRMFLAQDQQANISNGGHFDNLAWFQAALVSDSDDDRQQSRFTIIAPAMDSGEYSGIRYGLEDESSRINLNAILVADQISDTGARDLLLSLPGVDENLADAILDWLDEDEEIREFGAEAESYTDYRPKNGPLESVEELLLVRGMSAELLFGADANHNGMIDTDEEEFVNSDDGSSGRGLSAFFTLYSQESNLNPDGQPKIDLNSDDLQQLYQDLTEQLSEAQAKYIISYRKTGPYLGRDEVTGSDTGKIELDFSEEGSAEGQFPLTQVLDLVDAKIQIQKPEEDGDSNGNGTSGPPGGNNGPGGDPPPEADIYDSPFKSTDAETLARLMDIATVNTSEVIPGRINVNQAPRAVLLGIPEMTEEMVESIVGMRTEEITDVDSPQRHETWLLAEGIVDLDEMKAMTPFVTSGGSVFRAQIVGFFEKGASSSRIEVVVDATEPIPRVQFWRDLGHLGRGYSRDILSSQSNQ